MQTIVAWHFPLCVLIIAIAIQHNCRVILILVLAVDLNLAKNVAKVVVLTRSISASRPRGALVIDFALCPQSNSLSVRARPGNAQRKPFMHLPRTKGQTCRTVASR